MAYVWVQQWFALPVVVEDQMGDALGETGLLPQAPAKDGQLVAKSRPASANNPSHPDSTPTATSAAFHAQYNSFPPAQRSPDAHRPAQQQNAYAYNMQGQYPSAFNMGPMAGALPDYTAAMPGHNPSQSPHAAQHGISGASTSALVYQLQQISQYPQATMGYASQPSFGSAYAPSQYPPSYPPFAPGQHRPMGPGQLPHSYAPYPQTQPYMYYPTPYPGQSSMTQAYGPQRMDTEGRRASLPTAHATDGGMLVANFTNVAGNVTGQNITGDVGSGAPISPGSLQVIPRSASEASLGSVPRGPPRKPKQSGHALWVGNLPPGTTVLDLKDHFSRDATADIESLFLISKSNCAFVNYRTEASCTGAMHRFHDSRFHGVRLVCRLRRSAAPASGVPTGPSAMSVPRQPSISPQPASTTSEPDNIAEEADSTPDGVDADQGNVTRVAEKFFIVKSLTLQDLELSVRNGIWATQAHNEEVLNKAYGSANNVYLIFSANKSGEYFGYARMASPITEEGTDLISPVPEAQASEVVDSPKSIPTPATEWAPRGRIIDDSARGTIFWEADLSDDEEEINKDEDPVQPSDAGPSPQTWGKPFRIDWLSTNRLPFYRTRGLRNPWNANREVKIARDGTELETSVGRRLVQMFHRLGPPPAAGPGGPGAMPLMQMPTQMPTQMRPF